ncbi:MAG: hypothetical protein WAZ12_00070 [Candidatus Absconditicoccaceae bacterium]
MRFEDEIGGESTIAGDPVFNTRLSPTRALTREQIFFNTVLQAAEQAYRLQLPIDGETIRRQNEALLPHQVEQLLGSTKFQRALEDRGITLTAPAGVSGEQANFLRIFFDPNLRVDNAKRLRIAGVSQAKLDGGLRQEGFAKRYSEIAHDLLKQAMPTARQRVAIGIDQGKLDFIKFGMELTGEYDPRGGPTVDVMAFGRLMLDVISQEITALDGGDEVLRRIGVRMQSVMQGRPSEIPQELEAVVVESVPE